MSGLWQPECNLAGMHWLQFWIQISPSVRVGLLVV